MGGVGAGEGLSWDGAGNDESTKNAIATKWMVNLRILISYGRLATLCVFPG